MSRGFLWRRRLRHFGGGAVIAAAMARPTAQDSLSKCRLLDEVIELESVADQFGKIKGLPSAQNPLEILDFARGSDSRLTHSGARDGVAQVLTARRGLIEAVFHRIRVLIRCSLAASAVLALLPAHAGNNVLRVAMEGTYPPWSFKTASGNLEGFDVDIANALCVQMRVKCEIVAAAWDGLIPGLLANRYDALVASMSTTPERRKRVLFTHKYENSASIFMGLHRYSWACRPQGGVTDDGGRSGFCERRIGGIAPQWR